MLGEGVVVEERWGRILQEIGKIEARNEAILLIGDLNKHIGNDALGVPGNDEKISFGGELVRALLSTGKYICLNSSMKAKGGPFTRYDPSMPTNAESKSCLDLIIVSHELEKYLSKVTIDKLLQSTPFRAIGQGRVCYTDHYAIIIEFKDIPLASKKAVKSKKVKIWNMNKKRWLDTV